MGFLGFAFEIGEQSLVEKVWRHISQLELKGHSNRLSTRLQSPSYVGQAFDFQTFDFRLIW